MRDRQFESVQFQLSEIQHQYGAGVHILSDPFLLTLLARLCSAETTQPIINELIHSIYSSLLKTVVSHEFPTRTVSMPTRMSADHPAEAIYQGPAIDPETPVVSVNLARAGTYPSHICYTALNYFMNPLKVRQDHISIGRTTDEQEKVTGSRVSGHKIGGSIDDAIVLFPDPMGATGSTLVEAIDLYKSRNPENGNAGQNNLGKARKYVALHCIVTPEYLKNMKSRHPDVAVYAVRLDRGLSPTEVLKSTPGQYWDQERGLNEKHYIVPGGGGFGEIMNNAYV